MCIHNALHCIIILYVLLEHCLICIPKLLKLLEQAKRAEDDQDGMSSARRRIRERMRSTTAAQLAAKQEEEEEEEARRESEEEVRRTPDTDTSESPHRTPSPQRTPRPTSRPDSKYGKHSPCNFISTGIKSACTT